MAFSNELLIKIKANRFKFLIPKIRIKSSISQIND